MKKQNGPQIDLGIEDKAFEDALGPKSRSRVRGFKII
jgi:hypothetical protein